MIFKKIYIKYPIIINIFLKNINYIKNIYTIYDKKIIFYNFIYLKLFSNIKYKSLISNLFILKELKFLNNIDLKNKHKNKNLLSFSNKKIFKQKGLGKSRIRNKKNPIFIGGIKLFKNNKKKNIKINKSNWIKLLNFILLIKKSFIIFFKFNLNSNIKNLKFKNYLILSNKIYNNYSYNILNIKNINLILILKYKYIIINI